MLLHIMSKNNRNILKYQMTGLVHLTRMTIAHMDMVHIIYEFLLTLIKTQPLVFVCRAFEVHQHYMSMDYPLESQGKLVKLKTILKHGTFLIHRHQYAQMKQESLISFYK